MIPNVRFIHRGATLFVAIFLLFLGVTGTLIQGVDLYSIYASVPATNPNLRAMRESFDGPPDYAVRTTADYLAKPLPADAALPAMLDRVAQSARAKFGERLVNYVDLRMAGDTPVGQVGLGAGHAQFLASDGGFIAQTAKDIPEANSPASLRNTVKSLHRMTTFGDWALFINIAVVIGLAVLIVTGVMIYLQLLTQRQKIGRKAIVWWAGGPWRSLHRATSLVCVLFLTVVTISGGWLATESLYRSFAVMTEKAGRPPAPQLLPVDRTQLAAMLRTTLTSAREKAPTAPIKAIRLRLYGGYRQGVVVTGGDHSLQIVVNTATGALMSETEPGYPRVHFPFGWQAHQLAKSIHRGDIIGISGRWMDLLAGFAMVYLAISGGVMYWQMWRRRAQIGKPGLLWK